ncbi:transglutaminase domain-containing protein [Lysinibacillus antri]|uniref:DUF5050 domain-containing protein n=1 Tax=Lysinibacillus antri TaxID=2498145 RepID=A0A432L9A5_9BACI|nr:transglutaminase domain-containing protein [Lysinibacillus antri]RUL49812.1 DUF5050 domain-containing protein [Lysinibacillus antri]
MDKRKIVLATFMAVSISTVAISETSANTIENQWISENSGINVNPSAMAVISPINVTTVANLSATNLTELTSVIEKELSKQSTLISIQYTGNTTNVLEKVGEIIDQYRMKDDYLNGTLSSWKYGYRGYGNNVTITINLVYLTTPQQEVFIQSEVERIVDEIITPSMTVTEKVKAINDYIVLNTTYSMHSSTTPHAAYAILNEGKGVCQAYALLAYRLLQKAGIEARYVTGESRGIGHAWNLVKVDGHWYHLDTTWNDPTFADGSIDRSDYISYRYFLIPDQVIFQDHIIDDNGYPAATSERFMAFRDIEAPVQVGTTLYFPSDSNHIQLYKLDLSKEPFKSQKVSSTRVQELVHANGWLYFSNYSDGAFLSKMKLDGTGLSTILRKTVDSVKLEDNELVASYKGVELYREVVLADSAGQQKELDQVRALLKTITLLSPNFESQANQLKNLYDSLTNESKNLLSSSDSATIRDILSKYSAMKSLTFIGMVQWDQPRIITDAYKAWKINLNQEIANTSSNKSNIQIIDMFGDPVEVNISINGKQIVITPVNSYVAKVPYTLLVKPGLLSGDGAKLNTSVYLKFKLN